MSTATALALESEAKFQALFESSTDAIMLLDRDGFFDCNRATLEVFGLPDRDTFTRMHPADLSPASQEGGVDSRTLADRRIAHAFDTGHAKFEWLHLRAGGEVFPAEVWLTRFELSGRPVLQATVRDISERNRLDRRLRESERRYRHVVEAAPIGMFQADPEGHLITVNPEGLGIYGYTGFAELEQAISGDTRCLFCEEERYDAFAAELFEREAVKDFEYQACRSDGQPIWLSLHARLFREEAGRPQYVDGFFFDVGDRKRLEQELSVRATHDALTGLLNHGAIFEVLEHELSRARREQGALAVVLLDLDHFKRVNDTLGHLAGDEVLRQSAGRIQAAIRSYDSVGRFGGEEFLVVAPGIHDGAALELAGRIREAFAAQPMAVEGRAVPVTISAGVVTLKGTAGVDRIVAAADAALYRAKEGGRNRAVAGALTS